MRLYLSTRLDHAVRCSVDGHRHHLVLAGQRLASGVAGPPGTGAPPARRRQAAVRRLAGTAWSAYPPDPRCRGSACMRVGHRRRVRQGDELGVHQAARPSPRRTRAASSTSVFSSGSISSRMASDVSSPSRPARRRPRREPSPRRCRPRARLRATRGCGLGLRCLRPPTGCRRRPRCRGTRRWLRGPRGSESSTMSARSAGWISSSAFMSMFRRRRRCGSGSTMLQNSHRMEFGAIRDIARRTSARRQDALAQPAEDAPHADVHFEHPAALRGRSPCAARRSRR